MSPASYQNYLWLNPTKSRKITWSLRNSTLELKDIRGVRQKVVSRAFTPVEAIEIRSAFDSWDISSETINFEEVSESNSPDVKIGFVVPTVTDSFTTYDWQFGYTNQSGVTIYNRIAGYIALNQNDPNFANSNFLHNLTQRAIGEVLGLGDLSNQVNGESVMKWPVTSEKRFVPLSDLDIRLLRQLYGESSCTEDFPWSVKELKAKANTEKILADANKRSQEIISAANLDAKRILDSAQSQSGSILASAKSSADLVINQANSTAAKIITEANLLLEKAKTESIVTTITCTRGSTVKKVSGKTPKCPSGYKLRY